MLQSPSLPATLLREFQALPRVQLQQGQSIFQQGQACEHYFVLHSGQARVFTRSANGKEVLLYHMQPGEICILTTACMLGDKPFPAEAIADSALDAYRLSKLQFQQWLANSEAFRQLIFNSLGQRMDGLINTIAKLALESIDQRLAKLLLRQPHRELAWTHQQIADEIGSAREVVSRHLKKLAERGMVDLGRGKLQILDRDALVTVSLGPP